jgi:outer membrane receptor protein involved in Fe transport
MQGYDPAGQWVLDRRVASGTQGHGLKFSGRWQTPGANSHAFSTGWDSEWQGRGDSRLQVDAPLPAGGPTLDENYQARVARLASFVQDEWAINDAWITTLGLRWEGLWVHSQGNTFSTVQSRSSVFSPVLQTLWQVPGSKDQWRLALARTYKAPTPQELMPRRFYNYANSATTPDTEGNPALRPELAWGLDLAWDHPLSKASQVSLSAYLKRIADVVVEQLFTRPDTQGADQWVMNRVNLGSAWVQGAELEVRASLREFWPAAPAMDVHANLALAQSRVLSVPGPDNRLAEQTPWTLNLGLNHSTAIAGLSWGLNWNQQAATPLRLSALRTTQRAAQRTLDAYALWRQSPAVQWRLALGNALQGDIAETRQVQDAAGNRYAMDERFHPYLTVRLGVEMKL